jgi:hypothetical protein
MSGPHGHDSPVIVIAVQLVQDMVAVHVCLPCCRVLTPKVLGRLLQLPISLLLTDIRHCGLGCMVLWV